MNVKEFLSQVQVKQEQIIEKQEYIDRLRGSLGIAGIDYSRDKIQTSPDADRFADTFAKIFKAEEDLKQMKEEFVLFRVKVIDMIQKVPEKKHREVLNHVYLDYKSLKECADLMGFSYDYVRELHSEGLKSFEKIFPHQFC